MSRKPLKCTHCGKNMPRESGAGLHCGDDCAKEHNEQLCDTETQLLKLGFSNVDSDAPNIFVKDGVAVTLHEVKHVGIDKAMATHAETVRGMRSLQDSGEQPALVDSGAGPASSDGSGESLRPASNQRGRRTGKA